MTKRRIPPPFTMRQTLVGPDIKQFIVCSLCPSLDASGEPTAVGLVIQTESVGDLVLRLKTPRAVDELIQVLLRHKRDVWPEAS